MSGGRAHNHTECAPSTTRGRQKTGEWTRKKLRAKRRRIENERGIVRKQSRREPVLRDSTFLLGRDN